VGATAAGTEGGSRAEGGETAGRVGEGPREARGGSGAWTHESKHTDDGKAAVGGRSAGFVSEVGGAWDEMAATATVTATATKATATTATAPPPSDMTVVGGEAPCVASFDTMGLPTALLRGVYGYGFEAPSPIQSVAIPRMMVGGDLIAQAQSGTGKTGAFSVGLLARLDPTRLVCQAIVLSPTRELAEQTHGVMVELARHMGIRVHLSMGGTSVAAERAALAAGVHVIVACPGRLVDMVTVRRAVSLAHLRVLVLDEADRMLAAGFREDVCTLLEEGGAPSTVDIALFSATLPADAVELADAIMRRPVKILLKEDRLTLDGISQYHVTVRDDADKVDCLLDLYATVSVSKAILFVNTRRQAQALAEQLHAADFSVAVLHSDVLPAERRAVMARFRSGAARVLVSTDLTARGIDVQQVSLVVNFHMPPDRETYIHRIGRTGRYARKGVAITFVHPDDAWALREVESAYHTRIPALPADVGVVLAAV